MMAFISQEEENYVRLSLLLTGISPRAARNYFDSEFAPACLYTSLKKEYNKLIGMKKKRTINQLQWDLLFPRSPNVPDSRKFDITLIITLLRNLTTINPPHGGFDSLPSAIETTPGADLARIKHYRNYIAHLDDGKVGTADFNTAWDNISGAIGRLGGKQMKQECDHLKKKPLDQTNQEIMLDIKCSNDEIWELKETFKRLKLSHDETKESHEFVKKDLSITANMEIKEDTVPWNIRARIKDTLKEWKINDDEMFITTRAAAHVLKCIKENSTVTITASSGVGKTSILRHAALKMAELEYDVLPVTDPGDIVKYYNPEKKTLFVVDDLCGNFSVDQSDIRRWEPLKGDLKTILLKKETKLIAACRLQVFKNEKFEFLSVFQSCICNLLSKKMRLSKSEKQAIADLYLKTKASEITDYNHLYDCFPLLCKLYHDNPKLHVKDFFQNPFSVYEAEIGKLFKKGYRIKYCVLALCVMFNNKLKEETLTDEVNDETRSIIENTCEACIVDRGTSRLVLQDELNLLKDTFIKKEQNMYKIIHDKIFDFLAYFYGKKMIQCLIKNAVSGLLKERFLLERKDDTQQFMIIIPPKYHLIFIERIVDDWSKGKVQDVFSNINMKIPEFRYVFLLYLYKLDITYQRRLAHMCNRRKRFEEDDLDVISNSNEEEDGIEDEEDGIEDEDDEEEKMNNEDVENDNDQGSESETYSDDYEWDDVDDDDEEEYDKYDTALLHCCSIGDLSLVQWCCNLGVNINKGTNDGQYPIMKACEHGHTEILKVLLNRGVNFNKCNIDEEPPVMIACKQGHTEIVKMLIDNGVNFKKCYPFVGSLLTNACKYGHVDIVMMLLDRGVDCNKCVKYGQSPVSIACENGCTQIVKILLDRGVDCNGCGLDNQSLVEIACTYGYHEILKMLLDKGAVYKLCDKDDDNTCEINHMSIAWILRNRGKICSKCRTYKKSPVMEGCERGHMEIVKTFLDRGVDCNLCDKWGRSLLVTACKEGHTEIVKILMERGADHNECYRMGQSLLMIACEHGHTEIVKSLLNKGADYNKCDDMRQYPVGLACQYGHAEIVKMLLERGAGYNKPGQGGDSPVMLACISGCKEIVNVLLDRGVDLNECDSLGNSLVMTACDYGSTELVKMLLEKGADYNKCNWHDQSPVMKACARGLTEIVEILIDRGADYNKCDKDDQSAVFHVCIVGHTEVLKILLDRGADFNKCDKDNQSPLEIAFINGQVKIAKMLIDKGADCNKCNRNGESFVMAACNRNNTELLETLLEKGADCNICDINDQSPLFIACQDDDEDIVEMLLDSGADYNKCNKSGQSPVMMACKHGFTEILNMLLEKGADFDKCDFTGGSPLMIASEHGHTEIVKMLHDRGAKHNICDNTGQSAFMLACGNGHVEIVKLLIDKETDFNKCNKRGQSHLMNACFYGDTEIVRMLLDRDQTMIRETILVGHL
ncbi:unnamed protein product [Mytilus coruscus]|uniref:Uncharacterized protein n=1 Tax=Mytilus coruscus TaxID=42192 RepID=A0A6J8A620_MYTCO|nr:unnamed protein product [Mytilus coruscus]